MGAGFRICIFIYIHGETGVFNEVKLRGVLHTHAHTHARTSALRMEQEQGWTSSSALRDVCNLWVCRNSISGRERTRPRRSPRRRDARPDTEKHLFS